MAAKRMDTKQKVRRRRSSRRLRTTRKRRAGCLACFGPEAKWSGANAQALAAKHHDAYGHVTWVEVLMRIKYGAQKRPDRAVQASASTVVLNAE